MMGLIQDDTATGQYYLRARFYNPVIARFTQEDVYRGDGLNLYAYVSNNPVKYVDPSGYKECKADAVQGMESPVEGVDPNIVKRAVTPEHLKTPFTRNVAAAHQEILIYGDIPLEAIITKLK